MKGLAVRNAIEAHGWLGLIISVPLFIMFWAGAITLFYPEVQRWAVMPHFPLAEKQARVSIDALVNKKIQEYNYDKRRRLRISLPGKYSPYIKIRLPVLEKKQAEGSIMDEEGVNPPSANKKIIELLVDPYTGETLLEDSKFKLASFINHLHYTLKLPQGLYIVGILTFFFLVIIFTGIVIQFKNLIKHFFLYRHNKTTRYQMNDLHNVVGVISLPYSLMYALTGVMFNLSILFQIPTLYVLYQGSQSDMLYDAGFASVEVKPAGVYHDMPNLDKLIDDVEDKYKATVQSLNINGFYDENAVISFRAKANERFAKRITAIYQVKTGSYPKELNPNINNVFQDGRRILFSIHMASYADVDLRFVYFLLAIGVCSMIVAGNVLWIVKREKKGNHPKTIALMRGLTLGGCMGVILATALAFLLERVLPLAYMERDNLIMALFGAVLLVSMVWAFLNKNMTSYIGVNCLLAAVLILLLALFDIFQHRSVMLTLWTNGYPQACSVTIGLLLISGLFFYLRLRLKPKVFTP